MQESRGTCDLGTQGELSFTFTTFVDASDNHKNSFDNQLPSIFVND